MDTQEIWKHAPIAFEHVMASNLGRIKTLTRTVDSIRDGKPNQQIKHGSILSPWQSKRGYLFVSIQVLDKRQKYLVSRLVASAFCPGYAEGLTVNHIDGNKLNNACENLEWITKEENTKHEWRTGLVNLRGENHPSAKITAEQARNVRKCMNSGVSPTALARAIGVSTALLYKIKSGARWASVC